MFLHRFFWYFHNYSYFTIIRKISPCHISMKRYSNISAEVIVLTFRISLVVWSNPGAFRFLLYFSPSTSFSIFDESMFISSSRSYFISNISVSVLSIFIRSLKYITHFTGCFSTVVNNLPIFLLIILCVHLSLPIFPILL